MSQGFEGSTLALPILHPVNLKTTRLQEMIDWYATVVGLTTVFQGPRRTLLMPSSHHHSHGRRRCARRHAKVRRESNPSTSEGRSDNGTVHSNVGS